MQHGDLQLSSRPRTVVVLEGVLCQVIPIEKKRRFREPQIGGYHISWHDVPLKRMVYLKERWPDNEMEIVTFVPDLIDTAAEFLDEAQIPYDVIRYVSFDQFCSMLRFQNDLQAIYDSSQDRLQRYGQYGVAVQRGYDW